MEQGMTEQGRARQDGKGQDKNQEKTSHKATDTTIRDRPTQISQTSEKDR